MFEEIFKRIEDFYDVYPDHTIKVIYKRKYYNLKSKILNKTYTLQLTDSSTISVADMYNDLLICKVWYDKVNNNKEVNFMLDGKILDDVGITHIYPGKENVVFNLV